MLNMACVRVFQRDSVIERIADGTREHFAKTCRHGIDPAIAGFLQRDLLVDHTELRAALPVHQPVGDFHTADRLGLKCEGDFIADSQIRHFSACHRRTRIHTDAQFLFSALGGNRIHHADRFPVTRIILHHLDFDRFTAVSKVQLHDFALIAVRRGDLPVELRAADPRGFPVAHVLLQIAAEVVERVLSGFFRVQAIFATEIADFIRQIRPRQTGRIVRPEQFALRHAVRTEFADIADHRAVFVLADGLHDVRRARIIHAAARQTEYNAVAIFVIGGYKHEIRCRRRGRTVFPRPLLAAGHSHLLRDKVFLTVRRQNREDILCALVQHAACVLLREIRRRAGTNAAAVRPVLRQPALTELVYHGDNNLAVILKRECHLADVVVRCGILVAAFHLTDRRSNAEQNLCRGHRIAVADYRLVIRRNEIRQTKIVFVQQLEVLQRVYQTTIITGGACQVRVGFPNRFRNQHFIALTGEMQPLCFAVRHTRRNAVRLHPLRRHARGVILVFVNDECCLCFRFVLGHIALVYGRAGCEIID